MRPNIADLNVVEGTVEVLNSTSFKVSAKSNSLRWLDAERREEAQLCQLVFDWAGTRFADSAGSVVHLRFFGVSAFSFFVLMAC